MNDEGRPERRPTTDADQRRTTLARERLVVPEAELNGDPRPRLLVDLSWSFAEQCRRLIDSRAYRQERR